MFSNKDEGGLGKVVDGQINTAPAEKYPEEPAYEGNFMDLHGTVPLHKP